MAVLLGSGGILRRFPSETPCFQLGTERLDLGHRKTRSMGVSVLKWGRDLVDDKEEPAATTSTQLRAPWGAQSQLWLGAGAVAPGSGTDRHFVAGSRMVRSMARREL